MERIALCKIWTKDGIRYTQDLMTGSIVGRSIPKVSKSVPVAVAPVVEQHSIAKEEDELDVPQFMKDWMRQKAIEKRKQELREQSFVTKLKRMVK